MKYLIAHYYGKRPSVPEAVVAFPDDATDLPLFEVEVDDLNKFVEEHGPIILSPPSHNPFKGHWFIWVTDHTGRFAQK